MTEPLRTPPGRFCMGVDTGGTFTDAVVYDHNTDRVVAAAKTPTSHEDLYGCVVAAMTNVLSSSHVSASDIGLVAVSTTLATNALVEGAGRPAGLVAIGFEPEALTRVGLRPGTATGTSEDLNSRADTSPAEGGRDRPTSNLATAPVVIVGGGHSAHGDERDPLDLGELTRAIDRIDASVEAYAVAAQFSVRNAAHELSARDAIRERTGKPVTCSHELSPRLGGPRRAVTTLLNAQLISVTARFTEAIRAAMGSLGLDARLMIVRGDGSLVSAEFVAQRPIETVLSGPAASVIGARHLAASSATDADALDAGCLVVDIGGTTTDIAAIRNGAVVPADGGSDSATATVGGHATMVTALPTMTVGLGGDSEISIPPDGVLGELAVGPRRVVPLCVAARRHPDAVLPILQRQLEAKRPLAEFGEVLLRAAIPASTEHLDGLENEVLRLVDSAGGALPLEDLKRSARWRSAVGRLERRGMVRRAALTPTDACVVLGLVDAESVGDAAAAHAGAELFSRQRDRYGVNVGTGAADLSRRVMRSALRGAAEALLSVALGADGIAPGETRRPLAQAALDRRHRDLGRTTASETGSTHGDRSANPLWGLLEPSEQPGVPVAGDVASIPADPTPLAHLGAGVASPIVAIGAPAPTYAPLVAALLGTTAVVPAHAEVANAVGAAVARVRITKQITVTAPRRGSYRAHWGDDPPVWHNLDEAREWATTQATEAAQAEAAAAGAHDVELTVSWETRTAPSNGRELFVEATLSVTAAGRPSQH
ncbi:hydantoinase/oxoprolinase N-terminal domain-containing protein [Candidatus Poriferisodalis sp.]|uniref:hydantoinase/oxoprolinase N-terminal domain-containing protein n=1 Tax=Candidatus Poriferisodalis sp. TaxID=3101277 RepID=UPI003C6EB88B